MLELVKSLADYGADYRNFLRELLLHLREILLVKLAPADSSLLAGVLPEELERLRALAEALSQEELLRGLDLLTQAETEFRNVTDPRVALDLVLLKLVQMRRLQPFVEVVARVERMLGGATVPAGPAAALRERASRPASSLVLGSDAGSGPARPPRRCSADRPGRSRRRGPQPGRPRRASRRCSTSASRGRPSRRPCARRLSVSGRHAGARPAAGLRSPRERARRRLQGAREQAAGRTVALQFASVSVQAEAPVAASPDVAKKQRLREEAEKEQAVQEALDLFDGRVVDVRETKPGREDA
jgi:DNA polymerase-3 subunit gamma/tau